MIEELQSTSVTPDDIPGLLPLRKIAPKKTKAKLVTRVCGSMRAKKMSKVQEMKAQKKGKEEKRKKNAQNKEDIKIAFMRCKDKCVCEGKRKCAAAGLKVCEVCSNVLQSTCGKAACKIDEKRPMMIWPACSQSASVRSKRKLWYDQSESENSDSDVSEQSNFLDEHDVGHDDESEDETNDLEEIHYEDVRSGMWVLVFYEQEKWLGKVIEKREGQVRVRCLEKPFGVNMSQNMERKHEAVFYHNVYKAYVKSWQSGSGTGWKFLWQC